jgi:uncharacterized membrane protein
MADRRRPNRPPRDAVEAPGWTNLGSSAGATSCRAPGFSQESFGVWSEQFARFMGTPLFLIGLTAFAVIWIGWNTWAPVAWQFDPRELNYTLLTLLLSLQASYAAPLILLAQNRQADRDRVTVEQDRARDERNLADTEYLTREVAALRLALREVATRDFVRSELRALLQELDERAVDERTVDERTVDERATTEPSSSSPRLPSGTGERRSD